VCEGGTTSQIDIIIFSKDKPVLFRHKNFVILDPDSVRAIFEVKTSLNNSEFKKAVFRASVNGHLILDSHIDRTFKFFNGVFAYDSEGTQSAAAVEMKNALVCARRGLRIQGISNPIKAGFVNAACKGEDLLMLTDAKQNLVPSQLKTYAMPGLAPAAFLFQFLYYMNPNPSPHTTKLYFPYTDPADYTTVASDTF
jgi:hypothetical protein